MYEIERMKRKNLIRFDWAIKRLLRNKADFIVLEGFLSELLKEPIVIDSILESEGNQQAENDKFNRVDVLVKNSNGEFVIIEIQNQNEFDYFQRMAYGTSKIITEYLSQGEKYKNLKKVFSINIVYFNLGQGEDYIYQGKTDFIGVHKLDKLLLSAKQSEIFGKIEPSEILPEYYVIKVNQFNNIAKDTLDQWIYYLKNNEIRDEFTAQGIEKARELWQVDNLSDAEQKKYLKHLDNLHYQASMEWTLKIEAEDRIRKQGIEQGIEQEEENSKQKILIIGKKLKDKGNDIETIIDLTGLSKEDIENL